KNVQLRRQQVLASVRGDIPTAAAMVEGKIRNCRTLLRRNTRPEYGDSTSALDTLATLAHKAAVAAETDELLGLDGAAARVYFEHFTPTLRSEARDAYAAAGPLQRSRRPPLDPLYALL